MFLYQNRPTNTN